MLLAAEHPAAIGEAFIVGDGESIPFRDYFAAIASIAGMPPVERSIPRFVATGVATWLELAAYLARSPERPLLTRTAIAMVTTKSEMSADKITRVLGYRPRFTFAAAIEQLRAWYGAKPRSCGSSTGRARTTRARSRPS
jgi:nucleoside-diphosphate-sugar epimerase